MVSSKRRSFTWVERGGGWGKLLITLYIHYTIFLVMLFNIRLLRMFRGGGDTLGC